MVVAGQRFASSAVDGSLKRSAYATYENYAHAIILSRAMSMAYTCIRISASGEQTGHFNLTRRIHFNLTRPYRFCERRS